MPILHRTNNRVLPANSRALDVAIDTFEQAKLVERNKYSNAVKVQGSHGVIYHALTCGLRCHCRASGAAIRSRLNEDGTASPGFLNQLLTGTEFDVLPYGIKPADNAASDPNASPPATGVGPAVPWPDDGSRFRFVIDQDDFENNVDPNTPVSPQLPSLFDTDADNQPLNGRQAGTPTDAWTNDPSRNPGKTVVPDGVGPTGPVVDEMEFRTLIHSDEGLGGVFDTNCPVCMGIGYVGGYSVFNGWRQVLTYQTPDAMFDKPGILNVEEQVPTVKASIAEFPITLPAGAVSVDAVRVWNGYKVVKARMLIDGTRLMTAEGIMRFCDGKRHMLRIEFDEPTLFTHVELQVNQSTDTKLFSLPKAVRSNDRMRLQNLQDMTVVVSPKVPLLRPGDVLTDSTYNIVLDISSSGSRNDNKRTVMGWSVEARVVQPNELKFLLPRRRNLAVPNAPSIVRDNREGQRRT